ncbi:acyclic terpene utilization AtuA family protein [Ureibacillus aquaedulcis]|uniref:Acyclic terpene utilization AtuA family protein n=1 Tax=Ureibacillus aquaedulcis TaxID=3058421 RepID=A0ABT8GMH4_9BACL|nr:acyclic terpene utilization AtuA family protein [Ureibacillus sp. BA0131]MDN4492618.1 acyclic terpene utilization AtuA family protein [Ureibacillus sp. BA0131]
MIRIGSGAGFSGDRLEAAVLLAENGNLDYLVLECLAERTIALAQKQKLNNPELGYDCLLEKRIEPLLPIISKNKVRLISNMGAANPVRAAEKVVEMANALGISIKVAAVIGDDVMAHIHAEERSLEGNLPLSSYGQLISANAYLGAEAILPALESGADIIITGRVADPSLFVAPMVHHFGWSFDDVDRIAQGTVIGHLLECGAQVCGGYFADPGKKDVPDFAHLGFPFADVNSDGSAVISKLEGSGGLISLSTVKEQLLYEVINPHEYITPDVVADFTTVGLKENAPNNIAVFGCKGKSKPIAYKVSVGYRAGFQGEGEISYAGSNALGRAMLAGDVLQERLKGEFKDLRIDYIGSTSVHRTNFGVSEEPYEIRLRVAGKADTPTKAVRVGEEVEALYTNGPAGGGGVRKYTNEVVGIVSILIPRRKINSAIILRESVPDEKKVI